MHNNKRESVIGFASHDHKRCVTQALEQAEDYCRLHKLRFTTVRRRTLGILLENHSAVGAYEVLGRLRDEGLGSEPPVAYRALAFLLKNGFAHRVERLNAYVACSHPGLEHASAFLICTQCKSVAESVIRSASTLTKCAKANGFEIQQTTLEAEGQCPRCQREAAPH